MTFASARMQVIYDESGDSPKITFNSFGSDGAECDQLVVDVPKTWP